jgi:hypothetical protein
MGFVVDKEAVELAFFLAYFGLYFQLTVLTLNNHIPQKNA